FPSCLTSQWNLASRVCGGRGGRCNPATSAKPLVPANLSSAFSPTSKGDLPLLPPATEKVWNYLREQPVLAGFILAGGSALSLLIRHRLSEDLDFVCLQPRLPRQRLPRPCRPAPAAGFRFQTNHD